MEKNILLINSRASDYDFFTDLIIDLGNRAFKLFFLSSFLPDSIKANAQEKNDNIKKIKFGPALYYGSAKKNTGLGMATAFIILLPWQYIKLAPIIINYKFIKKIKTVICFNINEKIIISPLAYLFGVSVVWLEKPNLNYADMPKIIKILYLKTGLKANLTSFCEASSDKLKKIGFKSKRIKSISPGIKLKAYKHQESIFDTLAQKKHEKINYKFFTVGTIINQESKNNLEYLFRAAGKTLNTIPNLQIIVVGEGRDNKKLNWLSKQIGVDNIVWFVGKKKYLKKWLLNFNVYVVSDTKPDFSNIKYLLEAMESSLPIILPRAVGLDEYLIDNKSGFYIHINDSDSLAKGLIELKRNTLLRKQLGRNARTRLVENYTFDSMVKGFIEVL